MYAYTLIIGLYLSLPVYKLIETGVPTDVSDSDPAPQGSFHPSLLVYLSLSSLTVRNLAHPHSVGLIVKLQYTCKEVTINILIMVLCIRIYPTIYSHWYAKIYRQKPFIRVLNSPFSCLFLFF